GQLVAIELALGSQLNRLANLRRSGLVEGDGPEAAAGIAHSEVGEHQIVRALAFRRSLQIAQAEFEFLDAVTLGDFGVELPRDAHELVTGRAREPDAFFEVVLEADVAAALPESFAGNPVQAHSDLVHTASHGAFQAVDLVREQIQNDARGDLVAWQRLRRRRPAKFLGAASGGAPRLVPQRSAGLGH